ncbi:SDR family NAD(P)-dependent oxidoreductase, partial [Frankia sp. AgPm24]|uniref:SDR family NAD(P)-dependent oxidoreductase n=1 Tax=Frankia sp. AgPm24 TaxID=631128 RepID=UPI00200D8A6E
SAIRANARARSACRLTTSAASSSYDGADGTGGSPDTPGPYGPSNHTASTLPGQRAIELSRPEVPEPVALARGLARLWTVGVAVDWAGLVPLAVETGRRLALPTYAFDRQRYWLDRDQRPATDEREDRFWSAVDRVDSAELADLVGIETPEARLSLASMLPAVAGWRQQWHDGQEYRSWGYRLEWDLLPAGGSASLTGDYLVVVPRGARWARLTSSCVDALTAHGARVELLEVGGACDRRSLALALDARVDSATVGIVSLLALDETPHPRHPTLPTGLANTLHLLQEHIDHPAIALHVLTTAATATHGDDPLEHPAQAHTWGLIRTAELEHPHHHRTLIDLPATWDAGTATQLATALAATGHTQLALRPSGVQLPYLTPAPLTATPTVPLDPGGTVLITGGTGALGSHVARHHARRHHHLHLLSRQGPHHPHATDLRTELLVLGAPTVTLTACDTADRTALAAALSTISPDHPLTAVIHTAGIAGLRKPAAELDLDELGDLLAAKAAGARNLHELLRDTPLERFVLFSSTAAVWGSAGQAGYGAANAYLDALAEHRRSLALPATSIAWGAWAGAGMASDEQYVAWLDRSGMRTMPPQQAVAAYQAVADRDEACVTVADLDRARFVDAFTAARPRPLVDRLATLADAAQADDGAAAAVAPLAARVAVVPSAGRAAVLLEALSAEAGAVMGHPGPLELDEELTFLQVGFTSLLGVELRSRLAAVTGLRLPSTLIYDYPTPATLVAHLLERLGGTDDQPSGGGILASLRTLEEALGRAPDDEAIREEIAGRLETLVWRWREFAGGAVEDAATSDGDDLDTVTDDDIFELLDREL